jgi:CheY-like chemotaxis protein
MNAPTILLLDEETMMREATALLLTNRGGKVTTATSVGEAISRLEQQNYDVVVIDLSENSPPCGEVLRRMQERGCVPHRVIVSTTEPVPRVEAVEFTEVLTKPYPFDRLLDAVFGATSQRQPTRSGVFPLARRVKALRRQGSMRRGRV